MTARIKIAHCFGDVLRDSRMAGKLTQAGLAKRAGIDRTFVSLIERGIRQPSLETILRVAATLGLSGAELVARTEVKLGRRSRAGIARRRQ